LCWISTQYGTVKVPRSVLIQHEMFLFQSHALVSNVVKKKQKQRRKAKHKPGACRSKFYVYYDEFKVIFWMLMLELELMILGLHYTVINCMSNWYAKTDTQTCENATFSCEIHTHACQFKNIFLLRHAQFFRTHARVWFQHANCAFRTLECDFHTYECDFNTLECDFYMQSVIFTRKRVIATRCVWF
jgi:hypothetical protein